MAAAAEHTHAAWRRCVTEQALSVRAVPSPVNLAGHVYALAPTQHARPALDLSQAGTAVLDLSAAGTRERALRDLAEAATAARLRARGAIAAGIGAGTDWADAVVRGLYALLERDACARVGTGSPRALRLAGWRESLDLAGAGRIVDALAAVHGPLDFYLFPALTIVPAVGVVLRCARPPHRIHALACDLRVDRAAVAALDRLLRALAAFTLLPQDRRGDDPADPPWLRAALGQHGGEYLPCVDGEVTVQDTMCGGDLDDLRGRLRLLGLRGRTRILYPGTVRTTHAGQVTIAQCRIDGLTTPAGRKPTVWDPPDVAALRLTLPLQTKLGYEASRVRVSRVYHENSKIGTLYRDQPNFSVTDVPAPLYRLLGRAVRDFDHAAVQYPLPCDEARSGPAVEEVLRRRRSWATITDEPLTLAELGHLLRHAYGVTGTAIAGRGEVRLPLRAVPSAGGLYSNDLYLLLDRVDGVQAGLYYYHPLRHRLQLVRPGCTIDQVADYTGYPDRVRDAAALAVYVGSLNRLRWKYWERSYRMTLLDCGHLAENVVLMANSLGLVAHPMIAYVDDYFNELLGVDGADEVVLYLTLLGRGTASGTTTDTAIEAGAGTGTRHTDAASDAEARA